MLKSFTRHRPKHLLAVYVEDQRIEVLRADRQWRSWEIQSAEEYSLQEGETVYDYLQRLNLRPKGKRGTALVLFLPRTYYTFHREHYPATLEDQLSEALTYDWQENTFHEHDRTFHFAGEAVPVDHHLSVPIFALQHDVYERFQQVLSASAFETFSVIPSALAYKTFLPSVLAQEESAPMEILGRVIDPSHIEIHRFYKGALLDSLVIGKNRHNLALFREGLRCLSETEGECQLQVPIHMLCTNGECQDAFLENWQDENLPLRMHTITEPFVSEWVKGLFSQDDVKTFQEPLVLKPWQVPRVIWPLLVTVVLFFSFAFFQTYTSKKLQEEYIALKKQNAQLETQWKPIEQLQTRISKFQEDQKTLSEFNLEGYPLLGILTYLSQLTPQDTWINYFSLRNGQLMLRGESKSAIKYLSDLSKVEGFTDVRFASPVTRNPTSDSERFNLQFQIDADKLKKTLDTLPPEKNDTSLVTEVSTPPQEPGSIESSPEEDPNQDQEESAVSEDTQTEAGEADGGVTEENTP